MLLLMVIPEWFGKLVTTENLVGITMLLVITTHIFYHQQQVVLYEEYKSDIHKIERITQ